MVKIFNFIPKIELDAVGNLYHFIDMCKKELTVFGSDIRWDEWEYDGQK